jgi:hypothetical protein
MIRALYLTLAITTIALAMFEPRTSSPTLAATTTYVRNVGNEDDRFWNYDFMTKSVNVNNVDWAMSLLFWQGAEIDRVKDLLEERWGSSSPEVMWSYMNEGLYTWQYQDCTMTMCYYQP